MTTIAEYRSSWDLYLNLTLRELRSKYKRSFLGWAWSMINPLANTLIYTLVFSVFLKIPIPIGHTSGMRVYALYLLCALLTWNFFQTSINMAVSSLIINANLIKKTYFPRELLPASAIGATLMSHLIELGVLISVLLCFGNYRAIIYLPFALVVLALTTVFALGLGLLCSVLNVYFRDVEHFLSIFFLMWMYGTPIIYPNGEILYEHGQKYLVGTHQLAPHRMIPGTHIQLMTVMKINPMTEMELLMRQTLYNGRLPDVLQLLYYAVWAFAALYVGLRVFTRMQGRLAEEL